LRRLLTVAVVVALGGVLVASSAAAQATQTAASKPAGKLVTPRTPWGDPDLQGLWPSLDMQGTPLERPASFGERAVLTDAEYAAREETSQRQSEADAETTVVQRPRRRTSTARSGSHAMATRRRSPRTSS
jgi:hypothetical protein